MPVPVPVPEVVGVDGQRDELARMLLMGSGDGEASLERQVVAIVGDAGTGKNTLAHEVYRAIGGGHFDCRAWVSASENRSWKSVLADVLAQVKDPCCGGDDGRRFASFCKDDDDEELIDRSLEHKRYLIVLDDISLVDGWRPCFRWNSNGSRILITATRDDRVVRSPWPRVVTSFYYMSSLTGDYARLLFHRRVFGGSEDRCPPELAEVADQVLQRCHGSPLAISVLSGLLANKPPTRPVWERVDSCLGLSTTRSSSGSSRTEDICLMGYFALPNHLKTCLAYLNSVFPAHLPICRHRAVRSWIAESFVVSDDEHGASYFDDLVTRNMIHPAAGRHGCCDDGEPDQEVYYTIHGVIRRILARDKDLATLLLLDNNNGKKNEPSSSKSSSSSGGELPRIRRLSVTKAEDEDVGSIIQAGSSMDVSHSRSLFIFGGGALPPTLSFRDFVFLRVLYLEGCYDGSLENRHVVEISELVHLRYLSIRDHTAVTQLTDQICQLQHLETLDLRGTSVQQLPSSAVSLQRLRHLLCGDKMRLPEWIGKLPALCHLSRFDIFHSTAVAMDGLGDLPELTELGIWWSPPVTADAERYEQFAFSIYRLKGLQSLCIRGGSDGSSSSVDFLDHLHHPLGRLQKIQLDGSSCYVNRIPSWFRTLPALAYIRIDVKEVKNADLRLLSELPSLRHLSLGSRTMPTAEKLVIGRDGFAVLQEFQLLGSVRPAGLAFEPQAMRMVESLLLSLHVVPDEDTRGGFSISIDQFMCLKQIEIRIHGKQGVVADASSELFEAQSVVAIRNAAGHPNCPAVRIIYM